jgi:hypothetical protein
MGMSSEEIDRLIKSEAQLEFEQRESERNMLRLPRPRPRKSVEQWLAEHPTDGKR